MVVYGLLGVCRGLLHDGPGGGEGGVSGFPVPDVGERMVRYACFWCLNDVL